MFRLNPPENFNFHNPAEWPDWRQRFERFRMASKLKKDDGEMQIIVLVYAMCKEAEHVLKTFEYDERGDEKDYDIVIQKFEEYFVPKRNVIHERAKFHLRVQRDGESVEEFVRNLYEIAEHCDFGNRNEEIRDRLVIGISDKELSEKLQLQSDLTLEKAVEMSRQNELVKSQLKDQATNKSAIDAVQKWKPHCKSQSGSRSHGSSSKNKHSRDSRSSGSQETSGNRCNKCNLHHANGKCFAKGKKCRNCQRLNHFAVCCWQKKNVNEVHQSEEIAFLGAVTTCSDNSPPWTVNLKIHGKSVTFKIDSGADTSVISYDTYRNLGRSADLMPARIPLMGPGGKLDCVGMFRAETKVKGSWYVFPIYVIKGNTGNNLLGRAVAEQMQLIQRIDGIEVDQGIFGSFGLVKCDPVKITLKNDAEPYCLTTARRIPFPILDKVKAELKRLETEGIIEQVTKPTDWCAPMVPVVKRNGSVRICVDLKRLNDSVKREHFMLPNLDDIAPDLEGSTVFSKLDASSGFYQIPLDDESCELTTFITPFGRYSFRRVPFGITSAPEIFQRKMTEMLCGLKGVKVIIDDILIFGKNDYEHDERLKLVLKRINESGLKLNPDKCEFRKSKIEYFGHTISKFGIQPSADRIRAIQDMAAPTNVQELRRVIGMINYLGRFVPRLACVMKPMTDLVKESNAWTWGAAQDAAFAEVKTLITESPCLTFYDKAKPLLVSADASSYGLGGALFVEDDGKLKPVAFCSRKLTPAEENYAQIEKECLASLWACEKFSRYLVGLESFRLLTDHKPLVPLINSQDLNNTPLRCQRMLMKLRGYNAKAEHVPGKNIVVPDTLSRSPIENENFNFIEEIECYADSVDMLRPIADVHLQKIRLATEVDPVLQEAIDHTLKGWPDYMNSVPPDLRDMFASRNELSVYAGLLLYRDRIVIPNKLKDDLLDRIHEGHLGLNKCRARAQATVWWPGISKDIKSKVETCEHCRQYRPSQQKEPAIMSTLPSRPWQKIAADLCELDRKHYLVVTDYYSRFIEIAYLQNLTSDQVVGKMKNIFARWGIPQECVSDNGTQFTSETFRFFAEKYGFQQTFSSPHYPQSNGEAESAVKIAKKILRQEDIFLALMEYRATPIEATGVSPAEMMLGRKIRTLLPSLPSTLTPDWLEREDIFLKDAKYKERARMNFDKGSKSLSPLKPGDQVRVKTGSDKSWATTARVVEGDADRRSYIVQTDAGRYRRNRRHLQFTGREELVNRAESGQNSYEPEIQRHRDSPVPNNVRESDVYRASVDGHCENPMSYQESASVNRECVNRRRENPMSNQESAECVKPASGRDQNTRARSYGHSDVPVPIKLPMTAKTQSRQDVASKPSQVVTRSGRSVIKPKKMEDFIT